MGRELLEKAVTGFFNETVGHEQVKSMLQGSMSIFAGVDAMADRLYWQARVSYVYGIVERADGEAAAAEKRFTSSLDLLAAGVRNRESSDAYRLMADDYAQLMLVNGIIHAITTGWKIHAYAEKALALDASNTKAMLTRALYDLNAPRFAGGSVEKGLAQLKSLRARSDLEEEDAFAVRMWLAIEAGKRNDPEGARGFLAEARGIYPGSSWVRDLEKEAGKGQ